MHQQANESVYSELTMYNANDETETHIDVTNEIDEELVELINDSESHNRPINDKVNETSRLIFIALIVFALFIIISICLIHRTFISTSIISRISLINEAFLSNQQSLIHFNLDECDPSDDRDKRYINLTNSINQSINTNSKCDNFVDILLHHHFPHQISRFSNLLQYRPRVNCEAGRYLLMNDDPTTFFQDGTGSGLLHRNAVMQIALALNLTIVHVRMLSEHNEDESNEERSAFWPIRDWEITKADYYQCHQSTNVRNHVHQTKLESVFTLSTSPWTLLPDVAEPFINFIASRDRAIIESNGRDLGGFTIYSDLTKVRHGSMLETNIIWEIRYWVKQRRWNGEFESFSLQPLSRLPDFNDIERKRRVAFAAETQDKGWNERPRMPPLDVDKHCHVIEDQNVLKVAVHIRRGDIMMIVNDPPGDVALKQGFSTRYISHSVYIKALTEAYHSISSEAKKRWFVTIYSEGYPQDFADIYQALAKLVPADQCRFALYLNGRSIDTARRIIASDVVIMGTSSFPLALTMFNSVQVKLALSRSSASRSHGIANYIELKVNMMNRSKPAPELPKAHREGRATQAGFPLDMINDEVHWTNGTWETFAERVDSIIRLRDEHNAALTPLFLNYTYLTAHPKSYYLDG